IDINLSELKPLLACPHSPDNIKSAEELKDVKVDQVCIGSCTNSSLRDMLRVAKMLKGKKIDDSVSLSVSPGSKQVLSMLADCGALSDILASGARVLECACGPCIGMGFSPNSAGVSLRTFNRNFEGRSGTKDAKVYLVSPEVAVASALTGYITDPRTLGEYEEIEMPDEFKIDDSAVVMPASPEEAKSIEVLRGPNIKPFPETHPLENKIIANLTLKVGDNITTDHIMPAGAKILPYRSNIPFLSKFCFAVCDENFATRALEFKSNIIVGGSNYGQGSSREHAALVPLYLGVKAVIAKSFARIHTDNLINAGILPLTFANPDDYDKLNQDDTLVLENLYEGMKNGKIVLKVRDMEIPLEYNYTDRQTEIIKKGGLLAYTKGE
ncbi:MAG: aconitate hydratase, partial [Clostridia bacterium]|nr:aconitate hydratase [Clostridia bacterium]